MRNLIASLYLHFHLDFICTDVCMLVKGKFAGVVEQLNVKSTNSKKFLHNSVKFLISNSSIILGLLSNRPILSCINLM